MTTAAPPRPLRVLFPLASHGQVPQEVLKPAALLETNNCEVVYAGLDGGRIRFCPLMSAVALFEIPGRTRRLLAQARRAGRFDDVPSLRAFEHRGDFAAWLDGFDAVIVAGGHGRAFRDFIHDPLIVDIVARFHRAGKVTALICHAPLLAALPASDREGFIAGKTVACWPRHYEIPSGWIPWLGRYLQPYGTPVGVLLERSGAVVRDSIMPGKRLHAIADGMLVTGRGPSSTGAFATTILRLLDRRHQDQIGRQYV